MTFARTHVEGIAVQVQHAKLVKLLVAMGVETAPGWDVPTAAAKINQNGGVARYHDADKPFADAADAELYAEIVDAQSRGDVVEVVSAPTAAPAPAKGGAVKKSTGGKKVKKSKPAAAPKPARAKKKKGKTPKPVASAAKPAAASKPARAKRGPNPTANMSWKQKVAYWKKHPKSLTDRGPGVLRRVVDELKEAGKGKTPKPVTKEFLVGVLAKAFDDRTPAKMETYLNNMVPTGLRDEYGIHVWSQKPADGKGKLGYYIHGDGTEPQPKEKAK